MSQRLEDLVCTCLRMDAHERMAAWRRRAQPTIARAIARGNAVASRRIMEVIDLVVVMDLGPERAPEAFSQANWHRSHHMPGCPCSNRANPSSTVVWGPRG